MGKSGGRRKKATTANGTSSSSDQPTSNGVASSAAAPPPEDEPIYLRRAHELKEDGNRRFTSRDFAGALEKYDHALRLLPNFHPDRAVFHSNRAACLLQMRPVDYEAVASECSLALRAQPGYPRALLRRARALEALGRPDLALRDAHQLLAADPTHPDALDLARRLRSAIAPSASAAAAPLSDNCSRPSPAALGASIAGLGPCLPARPSAPPSKRPSPPPLKPDKTTSTPSRAFKPSPSLATPPLPAAQPKPQAPKMDNAASLKIESVSELPQLTAMRPLKLVYDHDIRLAQMPAGSTFRELREIVGKRFPSSRSVLLKFKDADGDLVTITSTAELRSAEASLGDGGEKGENLKMLRLYIVEVSSEQEPAFVEEEEVKEQEVPPEVDENSNLQNTVESSFLKTSAEEEAGVKEKAGKKDCGHPECKEVEIDDWLFEFAQLFRTQVGVDPDAHVDLHELGMELCSEALEETVTSEEAQELFEMAATKFQEVAALAFFNWGNVHMCAARKRIPLDESSPKDVLSAQLQNAYDWVRERYALAGQRYEDALRIKPDFYEGLLALGQQHFETAKLHWSFVQANKVDLASWDSTETMALFNSAEEKMRSATEMWEKVEEQRFNELKDNPTSSKRDELLRKRRKQVTGVDAQQELSADEAAEQAAVMRSQIHLFWGNLLFERSQVEYKLGIGDWKSKLDSAVERFKLAGASEADISTVVKNHASNAGSDEKKITSESANASVTNVMDEVKQIVDD